VAATDKPLTRSVPGGNGASSNGASAPTSTPGEKRWLSMDFYARFVVLQLGMETCS
jgi:hypothetical protein